MPVEPCDKKNKLGYRKLLNGELERGKLLVIDGANDAWIEEANTLSWNEKGTDCEAGQPDHATDAALYGWRAARAYLAKEPVAPPAPGTPEYAAHVEAQMKARAAERAKQRNNSAGTVPWMRRRKA
jgi:hypothetical protein